LGLTLVVGLFLVAVSLLPVARQGAAAMNVDEGDYWKYEASADVEGMSVDISMKMKVTGTEGSGSDEVFVVKMTGSGDLTGSYGGYTVSGSVDYTGEMKRLKSNFSLVSSAMDMIMSIKMSGQTVKMTLGTEQTFSPAIDDYIGDDTPGLGTTLVSSSTVTTTTSMKLEMSGFPADTETDTSTDVAVQTVSIHSSNQTITVPAGTFECYVVTYSLDLGGSSESLTYYFSDEVGNYVKQVGSVESMGGFGDGELTSYSYMGGGGASLLSGATLLIIIVVIVAVVVIVGLVLMLRRRGGAVAPMPMQMPPPEMGSPPPPPPGA